jgi:hypothetical protein
MVEKVDTDSGGVLNQTQAWERILYCHQHFYLPLGNVLVFVLAFIICKFSKFLDKYTLTSDHVKHRMKRQRNYF